MRFAIVFSSLILASTVYSAATIEEPTTFQSEVDALDRDYLKLVKKFAVEGVSKLPKIYPVQLNRRQDDYSNVFGYFGLNDGFCQFTNIVGYMPIVL